MEKENEICFLTGETSRLISSTQIITSVSSVVKELFENALDAGCHSVQVKLENFGLDLIEVKDDGSGISYNDVQLMFLPGYTSKLKDYKDLDTLTSYGFRGEALSAICQLGDVSLTTKTDRDIVGMTYNISKDGKPLGSTPSQLPKGTIVSVKKLFKALPVRKQFASSKKKMSEELKKVEMVVQSLSVIHPGLRVVLIHNKNTVWLKNSVQTLKQSFMQVVGLRNAAKMDVISEKQDDIAVDLIVPRKEIADFETLLTSSTTTSYVFINQRPVVLKEISKTIDEAVNQHFKTEGKHAMALASFKVDPCHVDPNLEPNKTHVLLNNLIEVVELLQKSLQNYYGFVISKPECEEPTAKKPKFDDSFLFDESFDGKVAKTSKPTSNKGFSFDLDESLVEPGNLCSQINKENCVLTSAAEVNCLKEKMTSNHQKLVVNLEKDLLERPVRQPTPVKEGPLTQYISNLEKELPQWPVKPPTPVKEGPLTQYISNLENELPQWPIRQTSENPVNLDQVNVDQPPVKEGPSTQEKFEEALLSIESSSKRPEISLIDWSRGVVNLDEKKLPAGGGVSVGRNLFSEKPRVIDKVNNGLQNTLTGLWGASQLIKPASQLLSQPSTPSRKSGLKEDDVLILSLESVSSQMGSNEHKGFLKFARTERPKIINAEPGIQFTDVAQKLVSRWKSLDPGERLRYEMSRDSNSSRNNSSQQKKKTSPVRQQRNLAQMLAKASPVTTSRPLRNEVIVSICLDQVIGLRDAQLRWRHKYEESERDCRYRVIGELSPNHEWLYRKGDIIGHIRNKGLKETIIYKQMMSNYRVPCFKMDRPLEVFEDELGQKSFSLLATMQAKYSHTICRYDVTSPQLTHNGFRVEVVKDASGVVYSVFVTELATDIPDFGIEDLREVLGLCQDKGLTAPMESLRPVAVKTYIEKEAMRIAEENCSPSDETEISKLIAIWQEKNNLSDEPDKCLHGKDIFVPIYGKTFT